MVAAAAESVFRGKVSTVITLTNLIIHIGSTSGMTTAAATTHAQLDQWLLGFGEGSAYLVLGFI